MGMPLGAPLIWHRRAAMLLAGQLPENPADVQLVLSALHELVDNFLSQSTEETPTTRATNVLPFGSATG